MRILPFLGVGILTLVAISWASPPKAAILEGNLLLAKACKDADAQGWVSIGNQLIYQADIVAGGSFEFHVLPGKYNVVMATREGCMAETNVEVKAGELKKFDLNLDKIRRPASAEKAVAR